MRTLTLTIKLIPHHQQLPEFFTNLYYCATSVTASMKNIRTPRTLESQQGGWATPKFLRAQAINLAWAQNASQALPVMLSSKSARRLVQIFICLKFFRQVQLLLSFLSDSVNAKKKRKNRTMKNKSQLHRKILKIKNKIETKETQVPWVHLLCWTVQLETSKRTKFKNFSMSCIPMLL